MAINEGNDAVTLQKLDRAWRIEIFIADDDTIQMRVHRERIFKLNGAIQHRKQIGTTDRLLTQIAAKSYTAGGVTRTGAQILQLINQMVDAERQADIDAPPAPGPMLMAAPEEEEEPATKRAPARKK